MTEHGSRPGPGYLAPAALSDSFSSGALALVQSSVLQPRCPMEPLCFCCAVCGNELEAIPDTTVALLECPGCLCIIPVPAYPAKVRRVVANRPGFSAASLGIEVQFLCTRCKERLRCDSRWEGSAVVCPVCVRPTRVLAGSDPPHSPDEPGNGFGTGTRLTPEEFAFLSAP